MRSPPITNDATSGGLPGDWQSANHFRLTRYNSANTKKLSASPSRDRLVARQGDADGGVAAERNSAAIPGRRRGVFVARHVEGDDLPSLDADSFDRHRDRPPEPAEPSAVGHHELGVAGSRAHDLPDEAERLSAIGEHRQAEQIDDAHGL